MSEPKKYFEASFKISADQLRVRLERIMQSNQRIGGMPYGPVQLESKSVKKARDYTFELGLMLGIQLGLAIAMLLFSLFKQ